MLIFQLKIKPHRHSQLTLGPSFLKKLKETLGFPLPAIKFTLCSLVCIFRDRMTSGSTFRCHTWLLNCPLDTTQLTAEQMSLNQANCTTDHCPNPVRYICPRGRAQPYQLQHMEETSARWKNLKFISQNTKENLQIITGSRNWH